MELGHHIYVCQRVFVTGQLSKCEYVIFSEDSRHNDSRLVGAYKFGVHHHAGDTAVAVIERMHFTNHKHHEYRTGKWVGQRCIVFEALRERAFHQLRIYKLRHSSTIVPCLENARSHVWSAFKQDAVSVA